MKACPKCQTKNQDSSQFLQKMWVSTYQVPSFQDKKEKVLGEKKRKPLWSANLSWPSLPLHWQGLVTGSSRGEYSSRSKSFLSTEGEWEGGLCRTDDPHDRYSGESGEWKNLHSSRRGDGEKDGSFRIRRKRGQDSSRSRTSPGPGKWSQRSACASHAGPPDFISRIKPSCVMHAATEWNLETLKGIQGGCLNYPPDVIPSTIEKDRIQIDEKIVTQWKPRV